MKKGKIRNHRNKRISYYSSNPFNKAPHHLSSKAPSKSSNFHPFNHFAKKAIYSRIHSKSYADHVHSHLHSLSNAVEIGIYNSTFSNMTSSGSGGGFQISQTLTDRVVEVSNCTFQNLRGSSFFVINYYYNVMLNVEHLGCSGILWRCHNDSSK
jgi:hypothetical protein